MDPSGQTSKSLIFEAENERDLMGFESYDEVFKALATSPNGFVSGKNWFLLFSVPKNGFVMQNRRNLSIFIPICPVKKCAKFTCGFQYCDDHCKDVQSSSIFSDGIPSEDGIRKLILQICKDLSCGYGWSASTPDEGSIYNKIEDFGYQTREVEVQRTPGSHSLTIEGHENNIQFHVCADPSGCFRLGSNSHGLDYYCKPHFKEVLKLKGRRKKSSKGTQKEMLKGLKQLVNGGKENLRANGEEKRLNFDTLLDQWTRFLKQCHSPKKRTYTSPDGQVFNFEFKVHHKQLVYYTPGKKPRLIPTCLYPLCGKRTGDSLVTSTRFCDKEEHQKMESKILRSLSATKKK